MIRDWGEFFSFFRGCGGYTFMVWSLRVEILELERFAFKLGFFIGVFWMLVFWLICRGVGFEEFI